MIYNNLIENEISWLQIKKMVENNTLPQALLFYGPNGSGKEGHAIELAALLNNPANKNDLKKIKIFQHHNIHLIIPLPKDKVINKKTESINVLSSKSITQLIDMKKEKMFWFSIIFLTYF